MTDRVKYVCGKFSSPVALFVFLGAYLLASYVMELITAPLTFEDFLAIELSFDVSQAESFYTRLVHEGIWEQYLWGLIWDFAYMFAYGGLLLSLIAFWTCSWTGRVKLRSALLALPVIAVAFDVQENLAEFANLAIYPAFSNTLIYISTTFSVIKWIAVLLSIVAVIFLALEYIFRRLFSATDK